MAIQNRLGVAVIIAGIVLALTAPAAFTQAPSAPLPAEMPALPFQDNPDPLLCGIPQPDGRRATVTGRYAGKLVQSIVYLYDSHNRNQIVGQVYPGTRVDVELRQINPALDYYFVRTVGVVPTQSGWIPAPFLIFAEPPSSGRPDEGRP